MPAPDHGQSSTGERCPEDLRIERVPGFFCAVGFSGHGFKIAPAVGQIMSDLVIDGRCDRYDISIFRHNRFTDRDLHQSAYRYSILG